MFQIVQRMIELGGLAQVPVAPLVPTPEQSSVLFSGPQFFAALVSGVLLAFGFQLLLTNLSVAAGISYMGNNSRSSDSHSDSGDTLGVTIRKVEKAVGIWTLVTVSIALFCAALLAVKLSLMVSVGLGAIVGLVIWATYFSILVWVSSTTVGSLVGSVVNAATSGFQSILGTATSALGAKAASNQVVATAEAAAAAVRRELGQAFDPQDIRENLEDYIQALKPAQLDLKGIRQEFENLLNEPQLHELATQGTLPDVDRESLVSLVSSRTDLSKRDINRIVDELEASWNQTKQKLQPQKDWMGELVNYIKEASPADLISERFDGKLDRLIDAIANQGQNKQNKGNQQPGMMQQGMTLAFNTALGMLMGRTDVSDFDLEKILSQLQEAKHKVTEGTDKVTRQIQGQPTEPYSALRADIENYVFNKYSWEMTPETIDREFRDVLFDPEADPGLIRQELERFRRGNFVDMLASRGVFTQSRIQEIASHLEAVRLQVLYTVTRAEEEQKAQDLRNRVERYLRHSPKESLKPSDIERDFKKLISDSTVDYREMSDRLAHLDRAMMIETMRDRNDLTRDEAAEMLLALEQTRDLVLEESKGLQEAAQANVDLQWNHVQDYLRNTGKEELNPEGIKRDLGKLLDNPQAGFAALRTRLSHFDRDTLVKLLSQRQELNEDEVNEIVDRVEHTWYNVSHAPQQVVAQAKEQYDQATSAISEYLRNTGKEELNPEGIQRDLQTLLNNPQAGAIAIRDRLSQMDRDTLVQLLSQRKDLNEEDVNRIIDELQQNIRKVLRAPRRLATRVKQQAVEFEQTFEDYLRNTGKVELNPDGIKRDLQLMIADPRLGAKNLGHRLAHIDRTTIEALLAQRSDISPQEAKEIVGRIMSVRDQFMQQVQNVQDRIKGIVDGIFAKIRNYLNSLDRPELNYEGLKGDIRTLFDDPQAGFDALRDRLSQFDRDTLIAVISSREDISEADANRMVSQIEGVRNNILRRAERMQLETQRRIEQIKHEAERQVEETRKAAEVAAWWLFFTALVSGIAAAGAGALGVLLTSRVL
ncbi:MFS transporter [Laspinema olomoucense]|uniref:MFS transporter n=1 Tax=Laspinema olomoucense D3b TaxID=2953688 RepID=A0ABT2N8M6_9CYAN|nr:MULTISPECIES: MFS transporter [unclassified Laspinema]MCT7971307.1 MFS transporter [Laspinema sp. D3d]MCT7979057.1 MFS transporter [Laspinema sp. D3b]MCT7997522.1 MFS transporter [Laspinema sp. D3c]